MVDVVVREWMQLLQEEMDLEGEEPDKIMEILFTIFYVDDAYIASRDPPFLQKVIDGLVTTFNHVGLETNTKKTQTMTCTPGNIRLQLLTNFHQRMRTGRTPAADWDAHTVTCRECGKDMRASSLGRHLTDLHEIYQQQVVAEELLDRREGVVYEVPLGHGTLKCPFPLCKGKLASRWMMRQRFRDLHPLDYAVVKKEGRYP
jgi:RNase P subunit RPR2